MEEVDTSITMVVIIWEIGSEVRCKVWGNCLIIGVIWYMMVDGRMIIIRGRGG